MSIQILGQKWDVRRNFKNKVLTFAKNKCLMCGFTVLDPHELDAHHITNRNLMPLGGYVPSNGISVCTDRSPNSPDCHRKCESLNEHGFAIPGYAPQDLYDKIQSSHWKAYHESLNANLDPLELKLVWLDFKKVFAEEQRIAKILECSPNETTWSLACSETDIEQTVSGPYILLFGKGRAYAVNDGAKRCN